jgi:hypothetical protein
MSFVKFDSWKLFVVLEPEAGFLAIGVLEQVFGPRGNSINEKLWELIRENLFVVLEPGSQFWQ